MSKAWTTVPGEMDMCVRRAAPTVIIELMIFIAKESAVVYLSDINSCFGVSSLLFADL